MVCGITDNKLLWLLYHSANTKKVPHSPTVKLLLRIVHLF